MKRLLYSHGEPAGIGIDLILYLSKSTFWQGMESPLVCIVDRDLLESRSKILNLNINFTEIQSLKSAKENRLGTVQFIQAGKCKDLSPGTLNPKNSKYILDLKDVIEGKTIILELLNQSSPVIVKDPKDATSIYILMQMRI